MLTNNQTDSTANQKTSSERLVSSSLGALAQRQFVKQCTDIQALDKLLHEKKITLYVGIDPTGPSLHVGHIVPLFAMAHLARAGHRVLALVGGGTARIGDPSGKTEMRKMLSVEEIQENSRLIGNQIARFFEFAGVPKDRIIIANNADWLSNLNYIEFLRDIGKHFSVNRMLTFEAYKQRLETGLSFIEFNYQLLQSYDYYILQRDYDVSLQIGGDDQWGNIVAGIDLIRRLGGPEVYGLTFPLITRADGKKMGKSEKGAIFLDPNLCPPYDLYQYWRNTLDQDVYRFLKLFTFLDENEIDRLGALEGNEINEAKEVLAFEYTKLIHGVEVAEQTKQAARSLFVATGNDLDRSAVPFITLTSKELANGVGLIDLFSRTDLCSSRAEARRLVIQGGAKVNDKTLVDPEYRVTLSDVVENQILLKAGKKRYFRVLLGN
ncbi:MAG: tyrosine--tRNA ligase [Spirochaetales bacterium]|nr:tyrosine--tRNA ligase [Spirochaetales bacterium]